jgi:hypothetical protein
MKKLTRERAVPIISAKLSWLTLGITSSGLPCLPKLANSNRSRARRVGARIGQPAVSSLPAPDQTIRTETGMPSVVIRLRTLHPIFASVR